MHPHREGASYCAAFVGGELRRSDLSKETDRVLAPGPVTLHVEVLLQPPSWGGGAGRRACLPGAVFPAEPSEGGGGTKPSRPWGRTA